MRLIMHAVALRPFLFLSWRCKVRKVGLTVRPKIDSEIILIEIKKKIQLELKKNIIKWFASLLERVNLKLKSESKF